MGKSKGGWWSNLRTEDFGLGSMWLSPGGSAIATFRCTSVPGRDFKLALTIIYVSHRPGLTVGEIRFSSDATPYDLKGL